MCGCVYYKCYANGSMCCSNICVCTCVRREDKRSKMTKSYLRICMCVYIRVLTEKYIAVDYVSARRLDMCIRMYEVMLTSMRSLV